MSHDSSLECSLVQRTLCSATPQIFTLDFISWSRNLTLSLTGSTRGVALPHPLGTSGKS